MRSLLLIVITSLSLSVYAQSDLSLPLLTDTYQASWANPALLTRTPGQAVISLPGVYNDLLVTNFTYNDLIAESPEGDRLTVDNAIARLEDRNQLRQNLDFETIAVAFRLGPLALSVGHRLRFNAFVDYPRTLPELIWNGNAQYIGQTVTVSPDFEMTGHHELSLGAAVELGPAISLGGRVKYLSGVGNLSTSRSRLSLTTDDEYYELSLDGDFELNTASSIRYDGFRDLGLSLGFGEFGFDKVLSGNSGWAFDLGASVELGPVTLSASALDLGGTIRWDEEVENFLIEGTRTWQGLDVARNIFEDSVSFGSIVDTLERVYEPTRTADPYSTRTSSRYYFSGQYDLNESARLGLIYNWENYRAGSESGLAFTGSYRFSSYVRLGAMYALRHNQFNNIGLNATFAFGPVRILAATDNIITAFRPKDSHQANFRLGLNYVIGQP